MTRRRDVARQRASKGGHMARQLLAVAVLLAGVLLGGATPASAHAVLKSSDPREGTVLKTAPDAVTVTFNESVALSEGSLRVIAPDNRPVTAGDPRHVGDRGDTARVPLSDDLSEGTYTVTWRVTSEDSHAISGAFTFSVGKPSQTRATATDEPPVDPTVDVLYGIGRYTAYGGLALLLGVAVFALACLPAGAPARALRRPLLIGWWALLLPTAALLLLRGPYASGDGPAGVADPQLLSRTVDSRPGVALLVRLALLVVVALLLRRGGREWRADRRTVATGVVLGIGLAATWAAADHASAGIQVPVAMASSVLHLLAMAVWLGGLTALLTLLFRATADEPFPPSAVGRFSRIALGAVAVLAATGLYQSWRGLGTTLEAFTTPYGRVLALKTGAVLLMLAVASHSRNWTERLVRTAAPQAQPALVAAGAGSHVASADAEPGGGGSGTSGSETGSGTSGSDTDDGGSVSPGSAPGGPNEPGPNEPGPDEQRRGLRRTVLLEVLIGVLVLVLTTVLTGSEPGRAATEAPPKSRVPGQPDVSLTMIPFDAGAPGARGKVQITLEPGRVGRNVVQAVVYGPDGSVTAIPEMRLTFTLASQRVGPLDAELADQHGYWGSDTLDLPLPGTWKIKATVRVSDIDQVTVSKTVKITP
ncbi:copper resistance protein CopC [Streptomyces sp. NPDC047108]|uniref:copper resistance CopC/CopD family protein n=1 Tax=Streptomyces sp. NPDC047108 TaxID=3155025 RepID=UPI0033FD0E5D